MDPADRDLDLVLVGATGYTGALVAEQLAEHAPAGFRWAVAGRSQEGLDALRARLGLDVPALTVDVHDATAVRDLAERTRAVATTVGPYVQHGDALVAACTEAGTDYLDITGELEFVDRSWLHCHAAAERTGARLVHACGFDSVPHDLGALHAVQLLPDDVPIQLRGYVRARGALSGGTFSTAVTALSRWRQASQLHRQRRAAEAAPAGRRARAVPGRPGHDPAVGSWVLPLPTLDPDVVARSARALPVYGPDFRYSHYAAMGGALPAAAVAVGVGATFAVAQVPPLRRLLLRARPPGSGPTDEQRTTGWFSVRFVGSGGGRRVVTEVAGGDPGYAATSAMLAQSALCLLTDDLPETAGQVTTAVAMGDALRARLERVGMTFRVLQGPGEEGDEMSEQPARGEQQQGEAAQGTPPAPEDHPRTEGETSVDDAIGTGGDADDR